MTGAATGAKASAFADGSNTSVASKNNMDIDVQGDDAASSAGAMKRRNKVISESGARVSHHASA
jgi:hypothetical protein